MGYAEKMQRLCALRGVDQAALAARLGRSKSTISRILSGEQEPKLRLAFALARALGVTLDYLADDTLDAVPEGQLHQLTPDEFAILKIVRRLGAETAMDRLLGLAEGAPGGDDAGEESTRRENHSLRINPSQQNDEPENHEPKPE